MSSLILVHPANIHLFKINNKNNSNRGENLFKFTRHQNNINYVVLATLLLTLNRFHILFSLFWCFHCRLWIYFTSFSSVWITGFLFARQVKSFINQSLKVIIVFFFFNTVNAYFSWLVSDRPTGFPNIKRGISWDLWKQNTRQYNTR